MILVALVREVAGQHWRPTRIRTGNSPSRAHESFEALHEAEVELEHDVIGVRFPANFLSRSVLGSPLLNPDRLPVEPSPHELSPALEAILHTQIQLRTPPTASQAASIAGISRRTLHRRLQTDGLTFQGLLDRVRFKLAIDMIQNEPKISTRGLAAQLHFGSASSFVRSFRRIAGVTPGDYRQGIN